MTRTILVIAAHPDDEVLGCGGTIARHAAEGDKVHILIVAEGATARAGGTADDVGKLRDAAQCAAQALGAQAPRFLGLPDNRLDTVALLDVIQPIEEVARHTAAEIVYTHHGGDLNKDHRIVHEAVVTACRPLPGSPVKRISCFETVSSTEWATASMGGIFTPDRFINIENFMETKLNALKCYEAEMGAFPHARSLETVEAVVIVRGAQSGLKAAEAFMTVLDIES